MKKKLYLLLIIPVVLVALLAFWKPSTQKPKVLVSPTPTITETANLLVDYGDGEKLEVERNAESGESAFSILEKGLKEKGISYEVKQYDFGVFVKSISGRESGSEKAWIYFVNGQAGVAAADKAEVKPGDRVEWKYITPN